MKKLLLFGLLVSFSILSIWSCQKKSRPIVEGDLVSVNGQGLNKDRFVKRYRYTPEFKKTRTVTSEDIKGYIEKIYLDELFFLAEAYELGLNKDREFQRMLHEQEVKIISRDNGPLYEKIMPAGFDNSEQELKKLYEKSKYQLRLAHILLRDKAQADSIYNLLKQGQDFAELAKKYSHDLTSADRGGIISTYYRVGMGAASFEEAAYSLRNGQISPPVKTPVGYHIIKLNERMPVRMKSFKEEKKSLDELLTGMKLNQFVQKYIDDLFEKFNLRIHAQALPLILKAAQLDEQDYGIVNKDLLDEQALQSPFADFGDQAWTIEDFVIKYNNGRTYDREPLHTRADVETVARKLLIPELMYLDGKRLGLVDTEEFKNTMKIYEKNLLSTFLRQKMIEDKIDISDHEVEVFYAKNSDKWKNEPLKKVKPFVINHMKNKRSGKLRSELLRRLKDKYAVEWDEELLAATADELNRLKTAATP